jgi:hypothetical protein
MIVPSEQETIIQIQRLNALGYTIDEIIPPVKNDGAGAQAEFAPI